MAGVVDQVSGDGPVSLELVCRRIAGVVEAYATSAQPSGEPAEFYAGAAAAEEVIAPALRSYVLKRARDERDLFSQGRGLLREGRPEEAAAKETAAEVTEAARTAAASGRVARVDAEAAMMPRRPPRVDALGCDWGAVRPQSQRRRTGEGEGSVAGRPRKT